MLTLAKAMSQKSIKSSNTYFYKKYYCIYIYSLIYLILKMILFSCEDRLEFYVKCFRHSTLLFEFYMPVNKKCISQSMVSCIYDTVLLQVQSNPLYGVRVRVDFGPFKKCHHRCALQCKMSVPLLRIQKICPIQQARIVVSQGRPSL